jgi:hypothetical protein
MNIKFILALAIMVTALFACGRGCRDRHDDNDRSERKEKYNNENDNDDDDDNGNEKDRMKVVYGAPYFPPNSNYALIPVRLADENDDIFNRFKKEFSKLEESSSSYSSMFDFSDLHNVIFYNKLTGESRPLMNANIYINRFIIPQSDTARTDSLRFILFTSIERDYNNDHDIDDDDGETVYITDYTGSAIKQVSPENVRLLYWHADLAGGMLYMTVNMDSNNDRKFNSKDDVKILRTPLANPVIGTEIIPDSLKTQLNNIYK